MKPSPKIFYSPQMSQPQDHSQNNNSSQRLNIPLKPLLRNLSYINYSQKRQPSYTKKKSALIFNASDNLNPMMNQINLPKIPSACDNYEQISNSQLSACTLKPTIKEQSPESRGNSHGQPNSKLHRHRRTIFLNQLLELVGPKGKWDFDYRTIHQCMKIATKYDPKFEILFDEEMKAIDMDNTIKVVKTRLTKTLKHNQSTDTNKKRYINLDIPKDVHRHNYPKFLMKEEQNGNIQALKKMKYVESAYEKQRTYHRKNVVLSKIIPIEHVKNLNEEKLFLFQNNLKSKLFSEVVGAKAKITKLKGKILTILEDSLCEFRTQLLPLLTPKEENKEANGNDQ